MHQLWQLFLFSWKLKGFKDQCPFRKGSQICKHPTWDRSHHEIWWFWRHHRLKFKVNLQSLKPVTVFGDGLQIVAAFFLLALSQARRFNEFWGVPGGAIRFYFRMYIFMSFFFSARVETESGDVYRQTFVHVGPVKALFLCVALMGAENDGEKKKN